MHNTTSPASPVILLAAGALMVWAIVRQLQARQLTIRSLLVIPAGAVFLGIQQVPVLEHLDLMGWSFLLVSAIAGTLAGLGAGLHRARLARS